MGQAPHSLTLHERRIERIRDDMGDAIDELSRRGHALLDWRSQVQQHGRTIAIAGGVVAALTLAVVIGKYRRSRRPEQRMIRFARAVFGPPPERVRRTKDVFAAGFKSGAGVTGKLLGQRLVAQLTEAH